MVVDTNLFIDFFKGNVPARAFFEQEKDLSTSLLVVMELIVGFSQKADIQKVETFLKRSNIRVFPPTEEISHIAYMLFCAHFHATGIGIIDALIAGTALILKEPLVTLNVKHFRKIKDLTVVSPYTLISN